MKKKRVIILSILLVIVFIVVTFSVTYAYLSVSNAQSNTNTLESACFETTFTDNNSIIKTTYPMSDTKGLQSTPYTFTFSNCSNISYQIILNVKNTTDTDILDYIRYSIDGTNVFVLSDASIVSVDGTTDSTILTSYLISSGTLSASVSKSVSLRVWLGEEAGNDIMSEAFEAEVVVYTAVSDAVSYKTVSLTNMLSDTSFEELTSLWTTGTSDTTHYKYGNRALKIVGDTSSAEKLSQYKGSNVALDSTHTYYGRYEVYHEGASGTGGLYWPIAEPALFEGQSLGSSGSWNIVSGVNTRSSFTTGSYALRLDYNNVKTASTVWYDGVMLIDLTAAFGSGNEPTKAWCDANIPYFEGTKNIIY